MAALVEGAFFEAVNTLSSRVVTFYRMQVEPGAKRNRLNPRRQVLLFSTPSMLRMGGGLPRVTRR